MTLDSKKSYGPVVLRMKTRAARSDYLVLDKILNAQAQAQINHMNVEHEIMISEV